MRIPRGLARTTYRGNMGRRGFTGASLAFFTRDIESELIRMAPMRFGTPSFVKPQCIASPSLLVTIPSGRFAREPEVFLLLA